MPQPSSDLFLLEINSTKWKSFQSTFPPIKKVEATAQEPSLWMRSEFVPEATAALLCTYKKKEDVVPLLSIIIYFSFENGSNAQQAGLKKGKIWVLVSKKIYLFFVSVTAEKWTLIMCGCECVSVDAVLRLSFFFFFLLRGNQQFWKFEVSLRLLERLCRRAWPSKCGEITSKSCRWVSDCVIAVGSRQTTCVRELGGRWAMAEPHHISRFRTSLLN